MGRLHPSRHAAPRIRGRHLAVCLQYATGTTRGSKGRRACSTQHRMHVVRYSHSRGGPWHVEELATGRKQQVVSHTGCRRLRPLFCSCPSAAGEESEGIFSLQAPRASFCMKQYSSPTPNFLPTWHFFRILGEP